MTPTVDPKAGRRWCPNCNMYVMSHIGWVTDSYVVKGKPIVISSRFRFCDRCNEEIFDRDLELEFERMIYWKDNPDA